MEMIKEHGAIDGFEDEVKLDDLFANSSDFGNERFVIIDPFKAIESCDTNMEFQYAFDELHSADYDKFMVALFSDEQQSVFRGNGVIVGPYLITAAHVAQTPPDDFGRRTNLSKLFFSFEGDCKCVCDEQRVHDGRSYRLQADYLDDVIIYKLLGIQGAYKLNTSKVDEHLEMASKLFNREVVGSGIEWRGGVCKVVSLEAKYANHNVWNNCFKIKNQREIVNGNSGGAVFRNDVVFGIITRSEGKVGAVIDARYLQDCINENEQK